MTRRTVQYRPATLDGPRTEENMALLLAEAAARVWKRWCERDDNGEYVSVVGQDEELDNLIRYMKRMTTETDIFYSGVLAERKRHD